MKPLTFILRSEPSASVDLGGIRPALLTNNSQKEISQMLVRVGKEMVEVGNLFEVAGSDVSHIIFQDTCSKLTNVGHGLSEGEMEVFGDLGAFAGSKMSGGRLTIHGSVGDFAASSFTGGIMHISGNAGDYLAGSKQGNLVGMNNGFVLVEGNVGIRAADRMRRGTVVIKGSCGAGAGSGMIAGTALLLGSLAEQPGAAMRRGTIICQTQPQLQPGTFADQGKVSAGFINLLRTELKRQVGFDLFENLNSQVHRYIGDRTRDGVGEILVLNG